MQDPYTKPSFIRNHASPFANDLKFNQPLCYRVLLTSAVQHWLRIHFKKVLTSFLWEMKKTVKTLIAFFF